MFEQYAHLVSAHKHRQINNINSKFRICCPVATSLEILDMGKYLNTWRRSSVG